MVVFQLWVMLRQKGFKHTFNSPIVIKLKLASH